MWAYAQRCDALPSAKTMLRLCRKNTHTRDDVALRANVCYNTPKGGDDMKKWKIAHISLFAIIFIVILLFVAAFIYEDQFHKTEIYRESSPNNKYVFILYQVGSPEWPFGPVKAQIKVVNSKGKTVDKESISIHNDGAGLYEYNVQEIRWYDTKLEFDCSGEISATYVLEFE